MRRCSALILAVALAAGCVPRDRLNTDCRWRDDTTGALDLADAAHRRHITLDVIVAEELAVRYADARTAAPRGPVREQCLSTLFPEISRAHQISVTEVEAARGRREGWWDAGVIAVFGLAYAALAVLVVDRIRRSFLDSRWVTATALVVAALPIAFIGTGAGEMWALLAEGARVSNLGHLSGFRGNRVPWRHHRAEIFAGTVVLFWLVALLRSAIRAQRNDPALSRTRP